MRRAVIEPMKERVANITERGARQRRALGVVFLVIALAAAAAMIAFDVPRAWRLLLAIPFGIAANGFLQAREKTCVVLSAMGSRETEGGGHAPMSAADCAVARRQTRSIVVRAVIFAAAATGVAWWI